MLLTMKEKRYTVKDVIRELGISRSGFYKWDRFNKIPKPKRDPMNNYRYWTKKDLLRLKKISGRG